MARNRVYLSSEALLSPGLLRLGQKHPGLKYAGFRFSTGHRRNRIAMRQMRDLRRYASPVIVQNAGKVNIAADSGRQVNVQKSKRSAKTGKAGKGKTGSKKAIKSKPKQLASKSAEESINIKSASEIRSAQVVKRV